MSKSRLIAVAVGIAAVLAVAGSVVAVRSSGSDSAPQSSPTTVTTSPQSSTSAAPGAPTSLPDAATPGVPASACTGAAPKPGPLDGLVGELSRFVEAQRGKPFVCPVPVELLSGQAFTDKLLADFDEDKAELDQTTNELRALGLIEPGVDIYTELRKLLSAAVLGFYDPEIHALVVRGTQDTPNVRSTLVHELVHAWDDQHFDLDRPELDDRPDETALGFGSVVEGNARRVENVYVGTLSADDRRRIYTEQAQQAGGTDLSSVPEIVLTLVTFPYTTGNAFVVDLFSRGGTDAVDAAFRNPPTTSEQVMHPAKYRAGEGARAVGAPPADGTVIESDVIGELVLREILATAMSDGDAAQAAAGWAGDHYVTWQAGATTCMRFTVVTDTPDDLVQLSRALDRWAPEQPDATVTSSASDVTVRTCA